MAYILKNIEELKLFMVLDAQTAKKSLVHGISYMTFMSTIFHKTSNYYIICTINHYKN